MVEHILGSTMMDKKDGIKIITDNRKARHDYFFIDNYEAGMELLGTEVKSLRAGRVNLTDAYCRVENGEMWLFNSHISPYDFGNRANHDPKRVRRLLLHKAEIAKIYAKVREKGLTIVPVKMYFVRGKVKLEIAVAQGKKLYDKRDAMAEKAAQRDVAREFKDRQKDF
jgi:SsrA-binding protein